MSGFRLDVLAEYWPLFVEGAAMTIKLTVACVVCGVMLGMLLGMARMASARHDPWKSILYYGVRWPVTIWVSFFRGTPLFVQIFLMYFAVLPIFIHPVDGLIISGSLARELRGSYGALIAGFLAISLNAGAYMSEVFRAGIQSLDKGQSEAARSVGMSYWQCMRHIILPQAFRRMLPAPGQQRHRYFEGLFSGVGNRPDGTRVRRAYRCRRFGTLLGALPHHFHHVLGDDARPCLAHPPSGAAPR